MTVCRCRARVDSDRVDRDVAALRDHGDAAGRRDVVAVAPEGCPAHDGDESVAVRPADRQVVLQRVLAQLPLQLAAVLDLGEAGSDDDGAADAEAAGLVDQAGDRGRRRRDDDGVRHLGQVGQRRVAADAEHLGLARVDAEDGSVEVGGDQVVERLVAVGVDARRGADDGDGARGEKAVEVHGGVNPD